MSKLATTILLLFIVATGLVTLYAALNAASVPFAIHMALMALWALALIIFTVRRASKQS